MRAISPLPLIVEMPSDGDPDRIVEVPSPGFQLFVVGGPEGNQLQVSAEPTLLTTLSMLDDPGPAGAAARWWREIKRVAAEEAFAARKADFDKEEDEREEP